MLAAGKASMIDRRFTATGSVPKRRDAYLSFMFDQGLVTRGQREDTLVFPNDVARLLVNETILPQSNKVFWRKWRNAAVACSGTLANASSPWTCFVEGVHALLGCKLQD